MCGIAGFFTGCPFKEKCENADTASCKMRFSASKVFKNWDEKATVRSTPRRVLDSDDSTLDLFPRNLVPTAKHPLIEEKYYERISEFLCLQLFRYLYFTINLELLVVNPNLIAISLAEREFDLSNDEMLAVHKMYVDEGYHALFCQDMAQQVRAITGISPTFSSQPAFMNRLRQMQNSVDRPELAGLIFTAVSETLITGSLTDVARDRSTPESVTKTMQDHARDESRHHVFFRQLFLKIDQLDPLGLKSVLHLVPEAVMAFIDPDREQLIHGLVQVGVTVDNAHQIVHETYPQHEIAAYAKKSAHDLLGFLSEQSIGKGTALEEKTELMGLSRA